MLVSSAMLVISACGNKVPDGFCECLDKSEELNAIANQVLLGNDTNEKGQLLIQLRQEQAQLCKDFEATSGPDMMEWKKQCEGE